MIQMILLKILRNILLIKDILPLLKGQLLAYMNQQKFQIYSRQFQFGGKNREN